MTERLRKILRGSKLTPMTADEQAVKIAVDNAGGGEDTYETVLEMQLGKPITGEGIPEWATAFDVSDYETGIRSLADERIPIFISSDGYKYGEKIELAYDDDNWTKNCTASAQGITWDDPNEDCFVLSEAGFIFGSNVNFSNTTVRILKKVSGGSSITVDSELSGTSEKPVQNKVITAALADKMDADEIPEATALNNGKLLGVDNGAYAFVDSKEPIIVHGTVDMVNGTAAITDDITIADIVAAFTADRAVFFQANLGEGYYVRLMLFQTIGNELTFSVSDISSNAATVYTCEFDNSTTGTFNHVG